MKLTGIKHSGIAALAVFFVPAVVLACPAAAAHACGSCGSSLLGYALALGTGIAVGLGSIAVEKRFFK
jgi:hypothetical protein